jgi:hypothetical protein
MFAGLHPLYRRETINDRHDMMTIYCTQPGCGMEPKVINRSLSGTNNYKTHYKQHHKSIPCTKEEADTKALETQEKKNNTFWTAPMADQSYNQRYRVLLLEFIIKNNLSFSIVDQPETKALFSFISPNIKQIGSTTLMKDLKARYIEAEEVQHQKLQQHIELGGRIALTTDAWAGNNKLDYIAVTAHYNLVDSTKVSTLLDIIELRNPVHSGEYLATKMLEVTDRLGITCAILSVTRDNASPNDTMLDEFEAVVAGQYDLMSDRDQAYFCCKFNRKEGDVRCCAHIYNIAVQAGNIITFSSSSRY